MKRIYIIGIAIWIGALGLASTALAQDQFGINALNNVSVYSTRSLTATIVGIVNFVLGFLGVIAILFFIYAGWLWFTSRGNAQQIQKAKMIMASVVIGLLIIFASYAVTNFIISRLAEVTGITPGGGGGPGGTTFPPFVTCPLPVTPGAVDVCQVAPNTGGPGSYVTITGWNFGDYTAGSSVAAFRQGATETPLTLVSCAGTPIWNRTYTTTTPTGTYHFYEVRAVVPDITAGSYDVRIYRDTTNYDQMSPAYTIDTSVPGVNIACLRPSSAAAGSNTVVTAEGINFGTTQGTGSITMPMGATAVVTPVTPGTWGDNSLTFTVPANALAGDVTITNDSGSHGSLYFSVTCSVAAPAQCGVANCCWAGECRASNICAAGTNVPTGPYINSISPDNGAPRSLVTILGQNFGETAGTVYFNSATGPVAAPDPATVYPAACPVTDNWHDNYIVVVVPVSATTGNVFVTTAAPATDSNQVNFNVNTTVRPGLCALAPTAGRFAPEPSTRVTASGINFNTTPADQMLYGDIPGYNITVASANQAQSDVPNLQPGSVGVQMKTSAGEYSNPLPFLVDNTLTGTPNISEITPNNGPVGQYITVRGSNFGSSAGHLYLGTTDASFDFPILCSTSYWSNSQIIAKVPTLGTGGYQVKVTRVDNQESNQVPFTVNTSALTPGLCAIAPNNGPVGYTPVDFYGENFGTAFGTVNFYNAAPINITSNWNDRQVFNVTVPVNAQSGTTTVVNSAGIPSNPLYFNVASCSRDNECPASQQCCSSNLGNFCATDCSFARSCNYPYPFHTQDNPFGINYSYNCDSNIQSPTPWPDGLRDSSGTVRQSQDAFPTANLSIKFTRNVEDGGLTAANFPLFDCGAGANFDPLACTTSVNATIEIINHNSNDEGVIINPSSDLLPDHWYLVRLGAVRDFQATGSGDIWNINRDPNLMAVGGWHFKTRNGTAACQLQNIAVSPQSPAADFYVGNRRDFIAVPQAQNCNLCSDSYTWNWNLTENAASASFVPNGASPTTFTSIGNIGRATLLGNNATRNLTPNYVGLGVSITQGAVNYPALTHPIIESPVLNMIGYGPTCQTSCRNALVYADFNTELAVADRTTTSNFVIRECTDIDCTAFNGGNLVTAVNWDGSRLREELMHGNFNNDNWYLVTVSNSLRNLAGYTLVGQNSWKFKTGSEVCALDSVSLNPGAATVAIGDTVDYGAVALAGNSACGVQPIQCTPANSCTWSWSSSNPPIATIPNNNTANNIATGVAAGMSVISSTATQGSVVQTSSGNLTVVPDSIPPTYTAPTVVSYSPGNNAANLCPNLAVTMVFSELMDPNSIRQNVKLYGVSTTIVDANGDGVANLSDVMLMLNRLAYMVEQPANYVISDFDSNADGVPDRTMVIINPTNFLRVNWWYRPVIRASVVSIHGMALSLPADPAPERFATVYGGPIDSFSWVFGTATNMCKISYVNITPDNDWFVCAKATGCVGDKDTTTNGNQHDYTAIPRDFTGIPLNSSLGIGYTWSLNNDGNDLLSPTTASGQNYRGTVANKNGTEVLIANVADNNPSDGIDMGSAVATANINIFLCENPWPSFSNFPWQELDYNFSTYYCPNSGIAGDTVLPTLGAPIRNPNTPSGVLREYIFPVSTGGASDIIAVRIMPNNDHLSVADWYKAHAPNPNAGGTSLLVDGYPALQVGNTVYIAASNYNTDLYTNIYILAYNIGARESTQAIFAELIKNFTLNINLPAAQNTNVCPSNGNVCSSDFDCSDHNCLALGAKLRRDLTRLGDLMSIKNSLDNYGNSHKACSNNSLQTCTDNNQCTSNSCVPYYPLLNAGTFVRGQSNSTWPRSWSETLSTALNTALPVDPINLFNGCTRSGFDPKTCWNEELQLFECPTGSALYNFQRNDIGTSYTLSANFESNTGIIPWSRLTNTLDSHLSLNLAACTAASANLTDPRCGNGRVDHYCTNASYTDAVTCAANGGTWVDETCDGGYLYNQCRVLVGNYPWWNEQRSGCYPPGSLVDTNGDGRPDRDVSCTWYTPTLTASICGGYCGDNILETRNERCEVVNGVTNYNGVQYSCPSGLALGCSTSSCQPVCGASQLPAAACGDGVWSNGIEDCDYSAPNNNNGLATWDCSLGGNVSCSNTCHIQCDTGVPYAGNCGNGMLEGPEQCDPKDYAVPTPDASSATLAYTCTDKCTAGPNYCGDGRLQTSYGEVCDTTLDPGLVPTPPRSDLYHQYACRTVSAVATDPRLSKCTPTDGGYCGDNLRQGAEFCDGSSYQVAFGASSSANQYQCTTDCMSSTGGYCGDGTVQTPYYACTSIDASNNWVTLSANTAATCAAAGGKWRPIEECDAGNTTGLKNVELVVVFDMSRSMDFAAANLCGALTTLTSSIPAGIDNLRVTIMTLADDNYLSTGITETIDDMRLLADKTCTDTSCQHRDVFNALVRNCGLYNATDNTYNNARHLRYLSFYNNHNNGMRSGYTVNTWGSGLDSYTLATDTGSTLQYCTDDDRYGGTPGGRLENWGYATDFITRFYNWLPGYQRVVIPVSDEYAWCGGATVDPPQINEDNVNGAPGTQDILIDIINDANDIVQNPIRVRISPVILQGTYSAVINQQKAREVANATGGILGTTATYSDWLTNITRMARSAFCDGNGDNIMDCSLPDN